MVAGGPVRPRFSLLVLLLALPVMAGCLHGDPAPPPEREVAVFVIPTLKEANVTKQFELLEDHAYWRTDLTAVKRDTVTMEATAPDGTRYASTTSQDLQSGFKPFIRVEDPQVGVWNLTVHARDLIEAEVRVLVPANSAAAS